MVYPVFEFREFEEERSGRNDVLEVVESVCIRIKFHMSPVDIFENLCRRYSSLRTLLPPITQSDSDTATNGIVLKLYINNHCVKLRWLEITEQTLVECLDSSYSCFICLVLMIDPFLNRK